MLSAFKVSVKEFPSVTRKLFCLIFLYGDITDDLASILDSQKMDSQTSLRLRDFFQKLVETDAQIKKLKQDVNNYYKTDSLKSFNERIKRSLKNRLKYRIRAKNKNNKAINKRNLMDDKNNLLNNGSAIKGFIVEEQKVLVEYDSSRKRNFPKCSHAHESKSHEKQLKHPFYKHSQRIDEMLKYAAPTITSTLVQYNKDETLSTDSYNVFNDKISDEILDSVLETKTDKNPDKDKEFDVIILMTSPVAGEGIKAANIISSPYTSSNPEVNNPIKDRFGSRKLMQADDEDNEELNYEDVKEVLTDNRQEDDDFDRHTEKRKRESGQRYKLFPAEILNPNWKGPMPFYPDEINTMIKHAAIQNLNIQSSMKTKYPKPEKEKFKKDVSDTEYIENYAYDHNNNMANMAQAYSDYGVVYNRKAEDVKDRISKPENRFKQSMDKRFFKYNIFDPEGLKVQFKHGTAKTDTDKLVTDLKNHIKFVKQSTIKNQPSPRPAYNSEYQNLPSHQINYPLYNEGKIGSKGYERSIRKVFRTLKSINDESSIDNSDVTAKFGEANANNTGVFDDVFGFIALMGDWFRKLSLLSGEEQGVPEFINGSLFNVSNAKEDKPKLKNNSDVLYPIYDSDMVDNIGHRSRVLMSVNENNTDDMQEAKYKENTKGNNISESDNIVPIALVLATKLTNTSKKKETKDRRNLTSIVKRSIDDSKLVFWNELYDNDEYGIKSDYLENVREKHLVKDRNVFQKTKDWIKQKFRNKTRSVRGKTKKKTKTTIKSNTVQNSPGSTNKQVMDNKPKARYVRNTNEDSEKMKTMFEKLTANMKTVCQEAARAIEDTKNIEVRDDTKEGAAATSMMQQLVRLMTDLVDIQVQQKTCSKLPSDLQNFLEWLTAPDETNTGVDESSNSLNDFNNDDNELPRFEKSTKSDILTSISEDSHQDERTECLGTIQAVQDLIMQYEGMNDEDKSKMSGVKEYLQHQLIFLNRKMGNLEENNFYKLNKKRDLSEIKRSRSNKKKRQVYKFVKNSGKKHTKTTLDNITESNKEKMDSTEGKNI